MTHTFPLLINPDLQEKVVKGESSVSSGSSPTPTCLFKLSLNLLLWLLFLTFTTIPLILLLVSKCFVIVLAKLVRKDLHSVSTGDAAFTLGSSWDKSRLSLGFILKLEGQGHEKGHEKGQGHSLDRKAFQAWILNSSLLLDGKMRSCLVPFLGYIFRKTFTLSEVEGMLDKLVWSKELSQKSESLEEFVDSVMNKRFEVLAPAWEFILLRIGESGESFLLFRIHHVLADGYSMLKILEILTGQKAPYGVKAEDLSLQRKARNLLHLPLSLLTLLGESCLLTREKGNPLFVKNPQKKWVYAFTSVSLERVKELRRKWNVHFASVLMSLIVESTKRFFLQELGSKAGKMPGQIFLADTLPCPEHPAQRKGNLCNHWTLGLIKCPLGEGNLLEIERNFLHFQEQGLEKFATNFLFPFAWLCPQRLGERLMQRDLIGVNMGLTSLIGGEDYQVMGVRVSEVRPVLSLLDSHPFTAFSWFTFSYKDKLHITLAGAPDLLPRGRVSLQSLVGEIFDAELDKLWDKRN